MSNKEAQQKENVKIFNMLLDEFEAMCAVVVDPHFIFTSQERVIISAMFSKRLKTSENERMQCMGEYRSSIFGEQMSIDDVE